MGMVVRTNSMAINANRQLGMNQSNVQKSLEKLSSGFKINRAADDASGLAISEKMKAQIKGLDQAAANSQDGISLIQTAEGATTEIHDMLNRMVELATKSANGTIKDEVDREAIQREVDDLNSEISRIAQSTNFNGINLLDGTLSAVGGGAAAGVPAVKGLTMTDTPAVAKTSTSGKFTTLTTTADSFTYSFVTKDANGATTTTNINLKIDGAKLIADDGTEYTGTAAGLATDAQQATAVLAELQKTGLAEKFTIAGDKDGITFESKDKGSNAAELLVSVISGADATAAGTKAAGTVAGGTDGFQTGKVVIDKEFTIGGKKFMIASTDDKAAAAGKDVNVVVAAAVDATSLGTMASIIEQKTGYKPTVKGTDSFDFKASAGAAAAGGGLKLQVGDNNADYNHVTVSVDNLTANGIGTAGLDVSSQDAAGAAVDTIKAAINQVSTNRANLGSLQNRLEHTINNLNVTSENMTAANSAIRDTDMAKEMMNYTKMNVLTQAAQAMLAQANQQPQAILQLLQ